TSRVGSGSCTAWQKKLTLNALLVPRTSAASSARIASGDNIAHGSDPKPPALDTPMAIALPCAPAIGAWMIGNSMSNRFVIDVIEELPRAATSSADRRTHSHR